MLTTAWVHKLKAPVKVHYRRITFLFYFLFFRFVHCVEVNPADLFNQPKVSRQDPVKGDSLRCGRAYTICPAAVSFLSNSWFLTWHRRVTKKKKKQWEATFPILHVSLSLYLWARNKHRHSHFLKKKFLQHTCYATELVYSGLVIRRFFPELLWHCENLWQFEKACRALTGTPCLQPLPCLQPVTDTTLQIWTQIPEIPKLSHESFGQIKTLTAVSVQWGL